MNAHTHPKRNCSLSARKQFWPSIQSDLFPGFIPAQAYPIINKVVALQYIEGNRYNKVAKNDRSSNGDGHFEILSGIIIAYVASENSLQQSRRKSMPKIHSFHVVPSLPERVHCLSDLAYNLRWAWDSGAIELFRRLDQDLWEQSGHNPALMLGTIDQKRLLQIEKDEAFLAHMDRVYSDLKRYLEGKGWFGKKFSQWKDLRIAYFSAEFGLTECLPNYAGGLGILAGDHLKSCSDLGVPLVGVGLLYQQGYFRQYLNADGWQQETYPENDFYNLPIRPALEVGGENVLVDVDFPSRKVWCKVWQVQVGRIQLVLLDTNIPQNSPNDRDITDTLYGGDREMRIQQEIVLGIGGMRVLKALNIRPTVCHMNEGHSAFLALERARVFMEENQVTYREARQATCSGNIFTTHTPVPAGFDKFDSGLDVQIFRRVRIQTGLGFQSFHGFWP